MVENKNATEDGGVDTSTPKINRIHTVDNIEINNYHGISVSVVAVYIVRTARCPI